MVAQIVCLNPRIGTHVKSTNHLTGRQDKGLLIIIIKRKPYAAPTLLKIMLEKSKHLISVRICNGAQGWTIYRSQYKQHYDTRNIIILNHPTRENDSIISTHNRKDGQIIIINL